MYMMPIFLWSMLVNQSRHRVPQSRYFVTSASTARPAMQVPMKADRITGSCSGNDSQPRWPVTGL